MRKSIFILVITVILFGVGCEKNNSKDEELQQAINQYDAKIYAKDSKIKDLESKIEELEKNKNVSKEEGLTLEESKIELEEIYNSIFNKDGMLDYISGEIVSDLKTITIPMKNDKGEVEDTDVEVYEFKFVTKDNTSHLVLLEICEIGNKTNYKVGDSIYFDFTDSMNSGWVIGENRDVLYIVIIE